MNGDNPRQIRKDATSEIKVGERTKPRPRAPLEAEDVKTVAALLKRWMIKEAAATGKAAIPALIKCLEDHETEEQAHEALILMGNPALHQLIENMINGGIGFSTARSITMRTREAAGAVIRELTEARCEKRALEGGIEYLEQVAEKHPEELEQTIYCRVALMGKRIEGMDAMDALRIVEKEARSIAAMGRIAIPTIVKLAKDRKDRRAIGCIAIQYVHDTSAIPALMDLAKDDNIVIGREAASAIAHIAREQGKSKSISWGDKLMMALIELIKHKDMEIRETTAEIIWELADNLLEMRANLYMLLFDALNDESGRVREVAAYGLGDICNPAATSRLMGLLEDEYVYARSAAVETLAKIAKEHNEQRDVIIPELVRKLSDESRLVRCKAASGLSKIKDLRASSAFEDFVKNADAQTKEHLGVIIIRE